VAAALLPAVGAADEVYLKSGGQLSGRVVSPHRDERRGRRGRGPDHGPDLERRAHRGRALGPPGVRGARGALAAGDVEGWIALAGWAEARGLGSRGTRRTTARWRRSPDDPRANEALGNVRMDGRWVSEDEGYRARGYVKFEGEWMTPAEHDAILRERTAEADRDRERLAAEARAREAEARAEEAEARAREAESQPVEGIPLWYGWAPGPAYWPTGPIVTPAGRAAGGRVAPRPVPGPKPVPMPRPVPR